MHLVSSTINAEKTENITPLNPDLQGAVTFRQGFSCQKATARCKSLLQGGMLTKFTVHAPGKQKECYAECKGSPLQLVYSSIYTALLYS